MPGRLNLKFKAKNLPRGQLPAGNCDLAWLGLLSQNGNRTCLFIEAGLTLIRRFE